MKTKILILFLSFISICTYSQIEERVAIDSLLKAWDKPNVPGCALGIIKDGELIYARGYGMANLEYDIPISASSVFRIASTSKQFTAACIILLVNQGKLSLDKTLKEIYPDFPEYATKVTVQHLLNHTSGIRDYLQLAYLKGYGDNDNYSDAEVMSWLVSQKDLNFEPGDEYVYSNSGYWLLGQIVHEITGMNLADFAKKEIFTPLGMSDTHFHNDHTRVVKNRATGYAPDRNGGFKISMTTLDMIGDGGIFTTINDIKKWDDAYYNSNILDKKFWAMMTEPGKLNNGDAIDYASGLIIGEYRGLKTIRHGGSFVGYRAELLRFPEERLSIAIFANRADANPSKIANQIAEILLKDKLVARVDKHEESISPESPLIEFKLSQLVGNYEIQPGVVVSITIKNDTLNLLQNWNQSAYNIVKTSGNTFHLPGEKDLSFTFSDLKDELAQTLTVLQGGRESKAIRKKEVDLSSIVLSDYTGVYSSDELGVTYTFELEDGILMSRIGSKLAKMDCTVSDIDQFTMELGLVRFKRSDGKITGFELDSGRVNNVKFRRN